MEEEDSLPSLCAYSLLAETTGHMADEDNLQYNDNVKKAKDPSRINSLLQGMNLASQSLSKTARPVSGI